MTRLKVQDRVDRIIGGVLVDNTVQNHYDFLPYSHPFFTDIMVGVQYLRSRRGITPR